MGNPRFDHLSKVRKENPSLSLKEAMKVAKKSYKKSSSGVTKKHHKKSMKHHKSRKH